MKKILTSNIVTPVKQPFTKTSLEHIQAAYTESLIDISNSPTITDPSYFDGYYPQIIYGCAPLIQQFGFWIIPEGAVKYQDEIFHVPATNVHIDAPGTAVVYKKTTYETSDPIHLSDGTTKNVHQINEFIIESGTTGVGGSTNSGYTYVCDYLDLIAAPSVVYQNDLNTYAITGNTNTTSAITNVSSGWSALTSINKINQFREAKVDILYESTTQIARSRGWHQFGTISSIITPTQPYYTIGGCRLVYDHIDNITYDYYAIGIKIEGNNLYYWDQTTDSGNNYFTNIDLKLRFDL